MKPKRGHAYAVGTGTYVGEMFVFVEETEGDYNFISIPKNKNRVVPKDKFEIGIKHKILEEVDAIDNDVFILLQKQFDFNKK